MQKIIHIIHGWSSHPKDGWFPWLKNELEERGFVVSIPELPDARDPKIDEWVSALGEAVGTPGENTYFVGHSLGCQAIVRYLESLPEDVKIGGAVFVAGFLKDISDHTKSVSKRRVRDEWMTRPIDLKKTKRHFDRSVAIFSDDDPFVSLDNQDKYKEELGSEIIIEHNKGHISGKMGTFELPSALEAIIKITG
ncbi:MAG: alpha/beta hydrolase [Candidatus Colwellbacteria bacterium]|nr:alpha/beta hydrolase [Candidatus Colwellbacteria bacterium]